MRRAKICVDSGVPEQPIVILGLIDGAASGIDDAVRLGVADRAVAKGGQLPAAGNGCSRKHRCVRPRDRRN